MKSKIQKKKEMDRVGALVQKAQSVVFVDFTKTPVSEISALKNTLRPIGATYKVIKKRLLARILSEHHVAADVLQFESQVAAVFSDKDISNVAGPIHMFSKEAEKKGMQFSMLGGYDSESSTFFAREEIRRIGQLPSRDVLIAQLAGLLKAPLNQLAYVLLKVGEGKK